MGVGRRRLPAFRGLTGSGWHLSWMRESGVLIGSQVSAVLTSALMLVLIARTLGPSRLGLFASFYGVAQASIAVVELGLTTWLLRELTATWFGDRIGPGATARRSELLSGAVGLSALAAGVVLLAALVVAMVAGMSLVEAGALLALMGYTSIAAVCLVLEVSFRAERRVRIPALATLVEKTTLILLVGAALVSDSGILAISAGYLAAATARIVFDLRRLARDQDIALHLPSRALTWCTARAASPFTLNGIVVLMITRLDVVIVAGTSSVAAGYYSVGDRALTALLVVPVIACVSLYPHLAGSPGRMSQAWKLAVTLGLAVSAVAGLAALAAPTFVPALFGQRYVPAVPVVQILLIGAPMLIFGHTMLVSLFTARREKIAVAGIAASMLLGTGCLVVGLLSNGIEGAAVGSVIRAALFAGTVFAISRRPARSVQAGRTFGRRRSSSPSLAGRAQARSWIVLTVAALCSGFVIALATPFARLVLAAGAAVLLAAMLVASARRRQGARDLPTVRGRVETLAFVAVLIAVPLLTLNSLRVSYSISFGDPLLVLAGGAIFVTHVRRGHPAGAIPGWLGFAGIGLVLASLLVGFRGVLGQNIVPAVEFAGTLVAMPLIMMFTITTRDRRELVIEAWLAGACLSAFLGASDLAFNLGIGRALTGQDYVGFFHRAMGLTLQPNTLGLISAMALPVAALRATRRVRPQGFALYNVRYLAYVFILVAGVLVSGSRGALLAAVAALFALPMLQPDRRSSRTLAVGLVLTAVLGVLVLDTSLASHLGLVTGERFNGQIANTQISNDSRLEAYAAALHDIQSSPIVGQGFQSVRTAHNIFLQLLQAGGVIALIALLAFIVGILGTAQRSAKDRSDPARSDLAAALGASVVAWLACGLTQNELYDRYLYIPVGLLLAIRFAAFEPSGLLRSFAPAPPPARGAPSTRLGAGPHEGPAPHELLALSGGSPALREH